uniref:snRNA-activating protein complex subunit 3 n=1 Tax=Phallusia mammillata TaxID=59560 RepID=A0A6F9DU75_9ASCI|nr:snRNA-activating protein complex subunit 3-like [Phallusia mammillata]
MPKLNLIGQQRELITLAEEHGYISPLVHIGQFESDCKLLLSEEDMDPTKKEEFSVENLSKAMKVDEETVEELEQVCSPSSLYCARESEVINWDSSELIPKNTGLVTLEHWRKSAYHPEKGKPVLLRSKYNEIDCELRARLETIKVKSPEDQVSYPNVVLTVCVNFSKNIRDYKNCSVDFYALGSQKLTKLRDKIPCDFDLQPIGHFTDNPNHPTDIKLKDVCPSSFFLIENTFFNDTRPPCIELSKNILKWAKENETSVPENCNELSMGDCTFNDLKLRLGYPYLYCHQGNCEHLVVFKDIRLLNSSDCQSRSAYPIAVSRAKFRTFPCKLCNLYLPKWVTRNDSLSTDDPTFFCDNCFKKLHYDRQGNKIGDFIAFPHVNICTLEY